MREELIRAARQARDRAYCPYSGYAVGAAVLGEDGIVYTGANVENVSYGLTICAERAAISAMIAGGGKRVLEVVVVTEDGGAPCGACRQVLAEFASHKLQIACIGAGGQTRNFTLGELLPSAFGHAAEEAPKGT